MVLIPLSLDKRLKSKRTVKQLAKDVRASIRSPRWCDVNHNFWSTLEKSQEDEFHRICTRKLLTIRLEIKKILRNLTGGGCSIEDLVSKTGLSKEFVLSILEKHGFGDEQENCGDHTVNDAAGKPSNVGKVVLDLPLLDMSGVRNNEPSLENPKDQHLFMDKVTQSSDVRATHNLTESAAASVYKSPREVTDDSAEISDLAKRLGAHFCKERTLVDQLRNINIENSFVQQLREIVTSSSTQTTVKQFHFIPSTPLSKPTLPVTIHCKETDVQTSIIYETPGAPVKEMRDNSTDLPSLDYLPMSEPGGSQELPDAFVIHEDISSSVISSDQSAGQVSDNLKSRIRTTISIARDGSAQFAPSETIKVSELIDKSLIKSLKQEPCYGRAPFSQDAMGSTFVCDNRTPHISELPWRPSSRRLHVEEVEISTSEDSLSLEVVSVGKSRCTSNPTDVIRIWDTAKKECNTSSDKSESESLTKDSLASSHQDDEHTYNQVSQITSE